MTPRRLPEAQEKRKTLDQMNSDELDQLHAEVDRLTAELADYDRRVEQLEDTAEQHARNTLTVASERDSYRKAWKYEQQRRARAEAAVARVRALADRWDNALAPDRAYARTLRAALDAPAPGPAATQATDVARERRIAEADARAYNARIAVPPREHCGHFAPTTLLTTRPTECVLPPGHQGSHADDRGCRWWPVPQPAEEQP